MHATREPHRSSGVHSGEADRAADAARLLEGIRRGDAEAFDTLAREQAPRMFRLALRLCGRREEAEDLVQETLVRALPVLKRFEGRAQLSTYLLRALSNQWKNRLRSRKRSRLVDWFRAARGRDRETFVEPDPVDARPSPLERLEQAERARRVRDEVARLAPDRRLVLLLREVEELSYEEIASMVGVPIGTVRSRLARAREDLRRALGEAR